MNRFVTGFYQKYADEIADHPDYWVLYAFRPDGGEEFFVLSHQEMAEVQAARNFPVRSLGWAERAEAVARGVDNVLAKDVQTHRDAWDKIVEWCGG